MSIPITNGQTISDFINGTFLTTYKKMVDDKDLTYLSFSLIFGGIELLGKCLDETVEFEDYQRHYPSKHFKLALDLFDSKYHNLQLRGFCRNGFSHCVKPSKNSKIVLAERRNLQEPEFSNIPNLCRIVGSSKRILFLEDFYSDFSVVCNKVLIKIKNEELVHPKVTRIFLPISNVELIP